MTSVRVKLFLIVLLFFSMLIYSSCTRKLPSHSITKSFLGSGTSITESSKSFTGSLNGFSYTMNVWSLPVSYVKKTNKNIIKIMQTYPEYGDDSFYSVRWTALPMAEADLRYYQFSKIEDNMGITELQEIDILLKAVTNERGNYYSYAASDTNNVEESNIILFAVYCTERKLLIILKRERLP
jgi:hypothetical protein